MADETKRTEEVLAQKGRELLEALGRNPDEIQPEQTAEALTEATKIIDAYHAASGKYPEDNSELKDFILRREADLLRAKQLTVAELGHERKSEEVIDEGAKAGASLMKRAKAHAGGLGLLDAVREQKASFRDLIYSPSSDEDVRMVQRANDDMLLLASASRQPVVNLDVYKGFRAKLDEIGKAINTSTDSNWVPTQYSPDLIETVYESTDVVRRLRRINFPQGANTLSIPVQGTTDIGTYAAGENITDDGGAKFTASQPNTASSVSVTCKSIAARTVVSWEMQEDSIIPVMPFIRSNMIEQFSRNIDDAVINGDTTATHVHTGITAVNDHRKLFDGWIDATKAVTTANVDAVTYWNLENIVKPLLYMREYAVPGETALFVPHPIYTQMGYLTGSQGTYPYVGLIPTLTLGQAAANTGKLPGQFYGYEVIPSAKVMSTVTSAGIYDGSTTTYSDAFWVHLPSWLFAVKRELTISTVSRPEEGQDVLVGHFRGGLTKLRGSSLTQALIYGRLTVA
jgi:HK97 family phage major capsid protein